MALFVNTGIAMSKFDQRSGDESFTATARTADDLKPKTGDTKAAKPKEEAKESSASAGSAGSAGGAPTAVTAPMPALPKGGGAIRGIGEKFSVNSVTGTASLQIPIATSPGRAGFHPDLSVAYDSGAGNGPFGHGFHLSVPQVTRKTDKGLPRYADHEGSDIFIMSGAEDLVPKRNMNPTTGDWDVEAFTQNDVERVERFSPRVEGGFVQIERRTVIATGEVYWRATTHDNVTSVYGRTEQARIAKPDQPHQVFSWLLEETRDDKGNVIHYEYKAENLQNVPRDVPWEAHRQRAGAPVNRYIKRIRYGNITMGTVPTTGETGLFEVVFDYGEHDTDTPTPAEVRDWPVRKDPFSTYRAGFEVRTYRLCRNVLMFHHMAELGSTPCLVASTNFTYHEDEVLTQLVSATHTGYIRKADGVTYTKKSHPPLDFAYTPATLHTKVEVVDKASLVDLPSGVHGPYQWVDLDGEGLPGVLSQQAGALMYKRNLGGGRFAPARVLMQKPSMAQIGGHGQQIADLDGDGEKELVFYEPPVVGYHDRTAEGTWGPFKPLPAQPMGISWADPNLRFIDLTGDGLEDVLVAWYDNRFLWFKSLGKDGYANPITYHKLNDEERAPGPRVVFADEVQTIFLADMSGDGLTDIVRILNGNVCYWPNIGNGRFGAKVQMGGTKHFDNPDQFDPKRIRLADLDGSGTIDILYIHRDGVRFYANRAGNSFAPPVTLTRFPDHSDLSTITAIDLLGTGTACLVWSSSLPAYAGAPMRYIDLVGGKKPYLLTTITNNLGLTTTLEYTPSTKLYREDAVAGRPWVTKLPFPVQTLTRTEAFDAVSRHRFVSVYNYHHGYFDGAEREFRGFGMVEQWDTESFSKFSGAGVMPVPANASDPELHLPPVHTKTWFHTGAAGRGGKISKQYEGEYWKGDAKAVLLPDTLFENESSLRPDEWREACRALKGQILRQELYAQDGSAVEGVPYLVSERSYEVRKIQPTVNVPLKGIGEERKHTYGVFFAHPREAIEYHYERNASDPRITHAFTLEVDAFGGATCSAAVGYPRRSGQGAFDEQKKVTITLNEVDVFHHAPTDTADWYRIGVPIATRGYELKGIEPATDGIFNFEQVLAAATSATALPYEATPSGTAPQKRLLSEARSLYLANDLSGPLALGVVQSLALPYESYAKAFTPALLTSALGGRATDAILTEGDYIRFLPDDDAWWVPSGRQIFAPAQFYLPIAFTNPFDNTTTVTYDSAYHLFVTQVVDPLVNIVYAAYDMRTLSPWEITDPNGNRARARFDELGMVVATAVMGKAGSSDGDTLDDPTTTFAYDLERFRTTDKPNVVHARVREQHGAANTRWQETYSYSDGSGHEVMRKVQAESGLAPQRDATTGALVHDDQGKLVFAATSSRWVGSGRTVLDNKGHPVKQYEPFFSGTCEYEDEAELVQWGVTPVMRYDALGRLVRTDLPNGTFSKVAFDPWQETHHDPNDTVLESQWYAARQGLASTEPEGRAAAVTAAHANTPGVVHLDALGRPFRAIEDNGSAGQYATTTTLDVEGNPLAITDHRGVVVQRNVFGMGGHKLRQESCDAGTRWMLADVAGATLRSWDERGFTHRTRADELRRVTHVFVQPATGAELLVERTVYGEALETSATTTNHRGKPYLHYDGAGVVITVEFDFKGNLLEGQRRLARAYDTQVSWSVLGLLTDPAAIVAAAEAQLETEVFGTTTAYDALNRPTSMTTPDASVILPAYNEAGLLEQVQVHVRGAASAMTFVNDIDYDAKGQREKIVYGDDGSRGGTTTTTYAYDPLTYRLTRLRTTRASDGAVLQNLAYAYDPVGNITEINDSAQQTVFFANDVALPKMGYVYDALYRLIGATGRELAGLNANDTQRGDGDLPLMSLPHVNDTQAVRAYTESYEYDAVGNLLRIIHDSGAPTTSWTRRYAYAVDGSGSPASNRLTGTSLPGDLATQFSAQYGYDEHGNMVSMPHLPTIGWNHRDEMVSVDKDGGGIVYFTYDFAGQRVRKVWVHSGLVEERIYIGGGFEVYRRWDASSGDVMLERETLHVMDGVRRIALVETKTADASAGGGFQVSTGVRFQMGNHLGSAVLEVDPDGMVISYEEYHPYGATAYLAGTSAAEVSRKRYRYTGKERDEETGLYYHGARYYAPWLGRWTAADPKGLVDGSNLYAYVRGNPVRLTDPDGFETKTTYLGASNAPADLARRQKFWGGAQYWSSNGPQGAGWYVKTDGNSILPGPAPKNQRPRPLNSEPGAEFLDWSPSKAAQGRVDTCDVDIPKRESRDGVDPDMRFLYTGEPRTPDPVEPKWVEETFPEYPGYSVSVPYEQPPIDPELFEFTTAVVVPAAVRVIRGLTSEASATARTALGPGGKPIPVAKDFFPLKKVGADGRAPLFYSVPTPRGGRLWVSTAAVLDEDVEPLVNIRAAGGRIDLLTGVHGSPEGGLKPHAPFFNEDTVKYANPPKVMVHNVAELSDQELETILNSNSRVIANWCRSERCVKILDTIKKNQQTKVR
jgi:RHS repeat-associated protein